MLSVCSVVRIFSGARLCRRLAGTGGHALLHLPGQMRHLADHALNQHQLAAVVHLVFLGAQQMLEARPRILAGMVRERLIQKL